MLVVRKVEGADSTPSPSTKKQFVHNDYTICNYHRNSTTPDPPPFTHWLKYDL